MGSSSFVSWSAIAPKVMESLIGLIVKIKLSESTKSPSDTTTLTAIEPSKSGSGIIVNEFPSNVKDPFPSRLTSKLKLSPSTSFAKRAIKNELSSSTNWSSISVKIGASLTGTTLIVTTPLTDVQVPSDTIKEKLSCPLKLELGV